MSFRTRLAGAAIAIVVPCWTAWADGERPAPPPRLTPEQRQTIHDCLAAKGMAMPPMPRAAGAGGPPPGDAPPPPDDRAGRHDGPPPMTDQQRQTLNACFAAARAEPPPLPPRRPADDGR